MIYQVTIGNFSNLRDELLNKVREAVGGLCEWSFRRTEGLNALELESALITRSVLEEVVQSLNWLEVGFQVKDLSEDYVHAVTNAPEAYDYPGTSIFMFQLGQDSRGRPERHLAIRKDRLEYQQGRNSSGLYQTRIVS